MCTHLFIYESWWTKYCKLSNMLLMDLDLWSVLVMRAHLKHGAVTNNSIFWTDLAAPDSVTGYT